MKAYQQIQERERRQQWVRDLLFAVGITLLGVVLLSLWWSR